MPGYALIAESDPGPAALYRHLVEAEGVTTESVRDGAAALELIERRGAPAFLLTDLSLPRADGFALLAGLRKLAGAQDSPAVVVCAFRELREAAARLREPLGISALLAKPAPLDGLRRAIKRGLAANFSMRSSNPGYRLPPAQAQHTNPRIDLLALERRRLQAVQSTGLFDELPPDADLTGLLEQAARELGVGAAIISLALGGQHWFKAYAGLSGRLLEERGVRRDWPLCRGVVESNEPLVVPDAAGHPLFGTDELVQAGTVRGFAAAPLNGPDGEVLGALAVFDPRPLALGAEGLDRLVQLARRVAGELELRAQASRRRSILRREEQERVDAQAAALSTGALAWLEATLQNLEAGAYLLDGARRVLFANRVFGGWLGRDPATLHGLPADEFNRLCAGLFDDPEGFLRRLRVPASGPFALREEFEAQRPSRLVLRWSVKPVQLPDGVGHLGLVSDVTAEADLVFERDALARTDTLTGLANRRGGEEAIGREVSRAERGGLRLSFALFDLDQLKQLAEARGTAAADAAIHAAARVVLRAVRGADLVVRWGADELLAVLPQTGLEGARSLAERVRASVDAHRDEAFDRITLSGGVAELHQGEDEGDALARAEERLQQAKASGRNRVL